LAYIGKQPVVGNFQICDAISVVNGQAAYTMQVGSVNVSPESANHMIVSLNGTIQKPNSSYTVSGSTITFSSNLATGDVIDFIQILGDVLDLGVPSDATVTTAKLNDSAVTTAKLNDASVSLAKLTATGTKDATTFLRGDNSFATVSSDYVNLTSATVSGSPSSVSIDGFFTSDYDIYVLKIYNFRQSSQTTPFYRLNVSGTPDSTASNYYTITGNWYGQSGTSNQTNDKYWGNEDKVRLFNWDISNNSNEVSAWETIIHNPLTAGDHNLVETRGVVNAQNLNTLSVFHAATQFRTGSAISGITVYAGGSSNISELRYSLYGLKK